MKNTITVYRLETKDEGKGPWGSRHVHVYTENTSYQFEMINPFDMAAPDDEHKKHGSEIGDHYISGGKWQGWFFGFTSIDQLKKPFPCLQGRKAMSDAGTVLRVYECPQYTVKMGAEQIIFERDKAILKETRDCATFETLLTHA